MGSTDLNQQLSELRALNTVTAFRDVLGSRIDGWKIEHTGHGEAEATASGEDDDGVQ